MRLERDQFADAFDALDSGVVILDRNRRVVFWNYWLSSASGIPAEQAAGKSLPDLFPGHSLGRLTTSIADALSLGSSAFLTHSLNPKMLPLRTRAGLPLVHNVSVRPFGPDLPYSYCLLQIVDVTVSTHRERVLRDRQNARYDAVVESASDLILTLGRDRYRPVRQSCGGSRNRIRKIGTGRSPIGKSLRRASFVGRSLASRPHRRWFDTIDRIGCTAQRRVSHLFRRLRIGMVERGADFRDRDPARYE